MKEKNILYGGRKCDFAFNLPLPSPVVNLSVKKNEVSFDSANIPSSPPPRRTHLPLFSFSGDSRRYLSEPTTFNLPSPPANMATATYPPPPPYYRLYKKYLEDPKSAPEPPPPIEGTYNLFGATYTVSRNLFFFLN